LCSSRIPWSAARYGLLDAVVRNCRVQAVVVDEYNGHALQIKSRQAVTGIRIEANAIQVYFAPMFWLGLSRVFPSNSTMVVGPGTGALRRRFSLPRRPIIVTARRHSK
jgi:hypothetical protein